MAGGTAAGGEAFGREDVGGEVRAAVQQEEPGSLGNVSDLRIFWEN